MTGLSITVKATKYEVTALPEDNVNARHWTLRVEYRGEDLWTVTDGFRYLGMTGTWDDTYSWGREPVTEEDYVAFYAGHDAWKADHRFGLDEALERAKAALPTYTINGMTTADVLARSAATKAAS